MMDALFLRLQGEHAPAPTGESATFQWDALKIIPKEKV